MKNNENKLKHFAVDTVKGVTLGISVAIPGLSAGTIAVAEKCYDTLIDSITGLKKNFKQSFLTLLPYVLGLIIGALAAFIGIQKGYEKAPFSITGAFAGLVLGSLPVVILELKKHQSKKELTIHILALVLCLLLAAGLGITTALTGFDLTSYMLQRVWWMYVLSLISGIVAAFACVVPGISGSMSMMVLGMYLPILNSFATRSGDLSVFNGNQDTKFIVTGFVILFILLIGALIGLLLASKIMKNLLSNHRVSTFYAILGLIIGSVISMFINSNLYPKYISNTIQTWDYGVGAGLFIVCCIITFLLTKPKKEKIVEPISTDNDSKTETND